MSDASKGKKVAITGAFGQLGMHCRARFEHHFGFEVVPIGRADFEDEARLEKALDGVDQILHLAGVNRGSDEEVKTGNPAIAEKLIQACNSTSGVFDIIYASSIHADGDSVYGNSKREAGELLHSYCKSSGSAFLNAILPNLFGEFSLPNYNNFTGTFCHKIVAGDNPDIHTDAEINLMHYGDVALYLGDAIKTGMTGEARPLGNKTSVKTVADKLVQFFEGYSKGVFPDVRETFDLQLFNTIRQVMFEKQFPANLERHSDARGSFFECIRSLNSGQTSFSTTVPGVTRGDHFHFDKVERFLVLSGNALIKVRRVYDDHVYEFRVSGDKPCYVDMPTLHTHNISNVGDSELVTLFWTHDFFDPENTDTYIEAV